MKKIDSNDYGGKIIGIGIMVAAIIPGCLKLLNQLIHSRVLNLVMWCFIIVGSLILIGFFIYLGIELRQDKKIDHYYSNHRNLKLPMDTIYYECSNCGNRKVKKEDTSCLVCGVRFCEGTDPSVQEILNQEKRYVK